jgi:hypothetical protein
VEPEPEPEPDREVETIPTAEEASKVTGPEPGTFTTADLAPLQGKVACRKPGCGKTFKNTGGRASHERLKHPEFYEQHIKKG